MITRPRPYAIGAWLLVSGALPSSFTAAALAAQQPRSAASAAPSRLSAEERTSVLRGVRQILAQEYVFPEMRAKLVERLTSAERAGRYEVAEPYLLAERVTEDLRAVAHDGHLSLRHAPDEYAAAIAPAAGDRGAEAFAERAERGAVRAHHGLAELKVLPGNIRYLRITGFEWVPDRTGAAYDDAMRFLREGDAVIIDLRGNGGGSSLAVQYAP
jgi:hypothetical protein